MLQIGPLKINSNLFLASMAGCTDLAFRLIAREHGAEFCFHEMSDSNSMVFASRPKTDDIHQYHPADLPVAAQLLGSDPDIMVKAARIILEINPHISFLDINAACPVNKIIKKKAGAFLLREPDRLCRMIDKLSSAVAIPITVKLRTGYLSKDPEHIAWVARQCEQSGAKALFVHGRTREQMYSGPVDHGSLKAIKAAVKIPVIASGNIFSAQKAREMLDLTGCDGLLVARGAFGHPWIFSQIRAYLESGTLIPEPPLSGRLAVFRKHLQYIEKYKMLPEHTKVGYSRKVAIWYLKKFKYAAVLRHTVSLAQSFRQFYKVIDDLEGALTFSS